MDSLLIYTAYKDKFRRLSNEQMGRLIRHVMEYQDKGTMPECDDDLAVGVAFDVVKYDMDVNRIKYEETIERRRAAGTLGGLKTQEKRRQAKQKQANASKAKQSQADASKGKQEQAKQAVNDNVNVNVFTFTKESKEKRPIGFSPPSLEDINAYIKEKKLIIDGKAFFDYFTATNWTDSKGQQVKSWKGKILTWNNHEVKKQKPKQQDYMQGSLADDLSAIEAAAVKGGNK